MKILILCTGNTCRSPMAEGIVNDLIRRKQLEDVMQVESMGLAANDGEAPTANAVACMKEIGIDISGHRARRVLRTDLDEFDIFYVMTDSHKNAIADAIPDDEDRVIVLDVPDPFGCGIEVYRECRDQIRDFFEREFRFRLNEHPEEE